MSDPWPESARRLKRLQAIWMMAIGGMLVVLCGLCSLGVQLSVLPEPKGAPGAEFYEGLFYAGMAVIGGIPMLSGAILFAFGYYRYRKNRSHDG